MNRAHNNIESRPFPGHRHRVGYAPKSGVWHIVKRGRRQWLASPLHNAPFAPFVASTLADVSEYLKAR